MLFKSNVTINNSNMNQSSNLKLNYLEYWKGYFFLKIKRTVNRSSMKPPHLEQTKHQIRTKI